jgi:hypothetical protein
MDLSKICQALLSRMSPEQLDRAQHILDGTRKQTRHRPCNKSSVAWAEQLWGAPFDKIWMRKRVMLLKNAELRLAFGVAAGAGAYNAGQPLWERLKLDPGCR